MEALETEIQALDAENMDTGQIKAALSKFAKALKAATQLAASAAAIGSGALGIGTARNCV